MPAVASGIEDKELIRRAREGGDDGDAAFRQLYERYVKDAWALLRALLRETARTEDALQETFFRVYLALDRVDADRPLRPWILQVARNVAIDSLRVEKKSARLARSRREEAGPAPDEDAMKGERAEAAREALAALPHEPRALLVARHVLSLSLAELAESWSVSERTVSERLREAAGLLAQAVAMRLGRSRS